jgi:SAM-dependent methyltransferase
MDPQHLGFPDAFFGAVVAQYVFATVPEAALDEFARVTKAGGEIILVNHLGAEAGPRCVFERSIAPGAAGLAAGIPLAAGRKVDGRQHAPAEGYNAARDLRHLGVQR